MKEHPRSLPQMLVALDYYLSKPQQIIIVGDPEAPDTRKMLETVYQRFIPNKILAVLGVPESQEGMAKYLPFAQDFTLMDNKATAYICIDYACALPTNDIRMVGRILDQDRRPYHDF